MGGMGDDVIITSSSLDVGMKATEVGIGAKNNFTGFGAQHKRVASTGTDRLAISVSSSAAVSSVLERRETVEREDGIILDGRSSAIHDAARITNWNLVAGKAASSFFCVVCAILLYFIRAF